jgi:hypothetical protein
MARLQILELPAGAGDDRQPFVLVVDETVPQRIALGPDTPFRDYWQDLAQRIGARGVVVTPETVDIPANELLPGSTGARVYLGDMEVGSVSSTDSTDRAAEAESRLKALAGEYAALQEQLNDARMWARHGYEIGQRHCGWSDHGVAPDWLTEGWPNSFDSCEHLKQAAEYDEALTRVRAEVARIRTITPTWDPVADLIEAALNGTPDARQSAGRPTHPDGTPYNYSEITAGGWHHCDGCRTWGQWTAEKPHDCIDSQAMSEAPDADVTVKP